MLVQIDVNITRKSPVFHKSSLSFTTIHGITIDNLAKRRHVHLGDRRSDCSAIPWKSVVGGPCGSLSGQIIDATIVLAPKQHNSREDNETIKKGETPDDWKSKPAKNRQMDKDARWTKKHERSYFGYKNHIGVDRRHKVVRRYVVSDASA